VSDIVKRLRDASRGRHIWRIQDKNTQALCVEFFGWEQHQAEQVWNENRDNHPEFHANNELVRVHLLMPSERLMIEAADCIEKLTVRIDAISGNLRN